MIINGETYACEACIRGHRVTNCKHSDRPLQFISRKGRPVSQCRHCRSMRNARSAHVKCDCGKRAQDEQYNQKIVANGQDVCCCIDGSICICTPKKAIGGQSHQRQKPSGDSSLAAASNIAIDSSDDLGSSSGDNMPPSTNVATPDISQYWHDFFENQAFASHDNFWPQQFATSSGADVNAGLVHASEAAMQNQDIKQPDGSEWWNFENEMGLGHDRHFQFDSQPLLDQSIDNYLQSFDIALPSGVEASTKDVLRSFGELESFSGHDESQTTPQINNDDMNEPNKSRTTIKATEKLQTQQNLPPQAEDLGC